MTQYNELKKEIFKNGKITDNDIALLNELLYNEEGMTRAKGDFLYELKNTISVERQTKEFRKLFVQAISSLLLEDEDSPGEISDAEAKWLRAKMQASGHDEMDSLLLDNLKEKSINFPAILNHKGKAARFFENTLYFSRYLTILAVIGSIISAIALFIRGSYEVIEGLAKVGEDKYEKMLESFVSSVDIYLFAMVLIIFGVGIYELFINKIDPVEQKAEVRPSWLQISSIDDLKSSLGKVILMVLIVSFFKHTLEHASNFKEPKDLLDLAIGVVLVSASLFIANIHYHPKHKK